MRLYSMPSSGNSRKVMLLLALLGRSVEVVEVEQDSAALAAAKAGGALPFGRAPALHLDDGRVLAESGAILWYLGEGSAFIPADAFARAEMLSWMFWEQYSHEPAVAVRAGLLTYPSRRAQATPERLADLLERGHAALAILDRRLEGRDWLVGEAPTLADIALYPYTAVAGTQGGFDMARFPAVAGWLARMASLARGGRDA